ncbi:hypothetical protein AK812_SmicGene25751 [Symbiodinium microadriaticum]|uniref:Uncharacterized protein n=1 Tax=Symbiodinium microadriaticum TaxID=2951 RepID=A0A1Q9DBA2_SYMMI|nr:hypothetical protein AK812_SmicGene25751 [Symbiodinium microadriaticum]
MSTTPTDLGDRHLLSDTLTPPKDAVKAESADQPGLDVAKEKVAKALNALPLAVVLSRAGEAVCMNMTDVREIWRVVVTELVDDGERLPRVKEQHSLVSKLGNKLGTEKRMGWMGFKQQIAETALLVLITQGHIPVKTLFKNPVRRD